MNPLTAMFRPAGLWHFRRSPWETLGFKKTFAGQRSDWPANIRRI